MTLALQVLLGWCGLALVTAVGASVMGRGAKLTAQRYGYALHEQEPAADPTVIARRAAGG